MRLGDVEIQVVLDSRKQETLAAVMRSGGEQVSSSVPQGKSKGEREAYSVSPREALEHFSSIKTALLKKEFNCLEEFDNFLLHLDGTKDKHNLGGNLLLVLSQTFARLLAKLKRKELWQLLREEMIRIAPDLRRRFYWRKFFKKEAPLFLFNLINGGEHAVYGPKFQEYLIVPVLNNPCDSLALGKFFFSKLKQYFWDEYKKQDFGDEGGLLIPASFYEKPLEIYSVIREKLHLKNKVRFALDVAASTFYDKQRKVYYLFPSKVISAKELLEVYQEIIARYNLISLEDPFEENAWEDFSKITSFCRRKTVIIGDDLTVTNPTLLQRAVAEKAITGVIVKPTQIGTVTETLKTIILAQRKRIKIIVSHRSGETTDNFIADLAWAAGAWGLKAGAPQPEERMVKYNRIIEIYKKQAEFKILL